MTINVTSATAHGSYALNANTALRAYDLALDGDIALSLTGGVDNQMCFMEVWLRQGATGGHAITLPSGVRWPGGVTPVPSTVANAINVFTFTSLDGGTTWAGNY